jgi:glycine dehydrogenase subunit 1
VSRFFFTSESDKKLMLEAIGIGSVEELYSTVPAMARRDARIGPAMPEHVLSAYMGNLAQKNVDTSKADYFLGAGCYYHHIPASVDHIVQRSEYMTAYTPYQPEVSQGSLSAMFEFQTIIARLTGMDVANGSMYDGATALLEATLMASRINGRSAVYFANKIHPHYEEVVRSSCAGLSIVGTPSADVACILLQLPDFHGNVPKLSEARALADKHGALLIVVINEIIALGLLPAPFEADIVVGEDRSLGVSMSFGGPHIGFFACKEQYLRQLPGRICGKTVDCNGHRAFALTICAREQHIKRERATSNICTNQFLLALAFTIHAALLGEIGFKQLAQVNHERCVYLVELLSAVPGVRVLNETFFNEITVALPCSAGQFVDDMLAQGVVAGHPVGERELLMAVTEMNSRESIERYVKLVRGLVRHATQ